MNLSHLGISLNIHSLNKNPEIRKQYKERGLGLSREILFLMNVFHDNARSHSAHQTQEFL